jgi:hypothetical protein
MYSEIFGDYNRQRNLANALQFAATGSRSIGSDCESVELVRDEIRQPAILEQAPATLVNHLVAIGITEMATHTAIELAPKWRIDLAVTPSVPFAATKLPLRQLIIELLDEAPLRSSSVRCWYGERMSGLESASRNIEVRFGWLAAAPLRPMYDLDALRCAGILREVAIVARQPNLPAALAKLPQTAGSAGLSHLDRATRESQWVTGGITNTAAHVLTFSYEAIAERRIAAIIVAVSLYRSDHAGTFPSSLADLVPEYLPSVPTDPMAGDGRPLGYHPDMKPAVVYSVGVNGIDDGGTSLAPASGAASPWQMPDAVFPLEPPPAPASQPSSSETESDP